MQTGAQFTMDELSNDPDDMIGIPVGYNDVTILERLLSTAWQADLTIHFQIYGLYFK